MFSVMAVKVAFDAVILCGLLYWVARHEADYDFQKVMMVVAGAALGSFLIGVALRSVIPANVLVWVMPPIEIVFMSAVIMIFCWISFRKSVLVVTLFSILHLSFGFAVGLVMKKMIASVAGQSTLVERQNADVNEIKAEMMRMAKLQSGGALAPGPLTNVPDRVKAVDEAGKQEPSTAATNQPGPGAMPSPGASVAGAPQVLPGPTSAPPTNTASMEQKEWSEARKLVKISGVSGRPGAFVALVNQRLVEVGATVSVPYGGKIYRWTVRDITRDQVSLEPRDCRTP